MTRLHLAARDVDDEWHGSLSPIDRLVRMVAGGWTVEAAGRRLGLANARELFEERVAHIAYQLDPLVRYRQDRLPLDACDARPLVDAADRGGQGRLGV